MTLLDSVVNVSLSIVLIVGAYQFYFWCQRQAGHRAFEWPSPLDAAIPLCPGWVWIYSGIYYPLVIWCALSARDLRQFNYMAFSYVTLLLGQMMFFLVLPVRVPASWREGVDGAAGISGRFLAFVQRYDQRSNCFPSMHVAVATLTALHLKANSGLPSTWGALLVALVAASCLMTKQHYLVDLPAGAGLGWTSFAAYSAYYGLS